MTTEERLDKMEKELHRARRFNRWLLAAAGLSLAVGFGLWAFRAGGREKGVSANEFVFRHKTDNARHVRFLPIESGPWLLVSDDGDIRAAVSAYKDGPVLLVADANGKTVLEAP